MVRFRIGNLPIDVTWSAGMIMAFIALQSAGDGSDYSQALAGIVWAFALFGSILIHELGHALAGSVLGLKPQKIVIHGFGGLCSYGLAPRPIQGVISSLAGPIAGLLLAAAAFMLGRLPGIPLPAGVILVDLLYINVFWSLFNLTPMMPLDGGAVMLHGLLIFMKPNTVYKVVKVVSISVALIVIGTGILLKMPFVSVIGAFVIVQNIRR